MVEHLLIAWQRCVFTCRAGEARMDCRQIPSDRRLTPIRCAVEGIHDRMHPVYHTVTYLISMTVYALLV
jgi:hypothetical protein